MKVSELVAKTYEEKIYLSIYEGKGKFKCIFSGEKEKIPEHMLEMEVEFFMFRKKGGIDIQVR